MDNELKKVRLLINLSKYQLAEEKLFDIIAADPENTSAFSLLATVYNDQGKLNEAYEVIQKALSLDPLNTYALYIYSLIYFNQEKFKKAEKIIRQAISLDLEEPEFFSLLAKILIKKEKYSKAIEEAKNGLALDPTHSGCLNNHAEALLFINNKEQAKIYIDTALEVNPTDERSHTLAGFASLDNKKAIEHFQEALAISPEKEIARIGLNRALTLDDPLYRYTAYLFSRIGYYLFSIYQKPLFLILMFIPPFTVASFAVMLLATFFLCLGRIFDQLYYLIIRLKKSKKIYLSETDIIASNLFSVYFSIALYSFILGNFIPVFWGIGTMFLLLASIIGKAYYYNNKIRNFFLFMISLLTSVSISSYFTNTGPYIFAGIFLPVALLINFSEKDLFKAFKIIGLISIFIIIILIEFYIYK
jgi:tetratricopeptide (TPR) repeat protein